MKILEKPSVVRATAQPRNRAISGNLFVVPKPPAAIPRTPSIVPTIYQPLPGIALRFSSLTQPLPEAKE